MQPTASSDALQQAEKQRLQLQQAQQLLQQVTAMGVTPQQLMQYQKEMQLKMQQQQQQPGGGGGVVGAAAGGVQQTSPFGNPVVPPSSLYFPASAPS
jgi:hypothetical protein